MKRKVAWLLAALMLLTGSTSALASSQKNVTDMNNQSITIGGQNSQSDDDSEDGSNSQGTNQNSSGNNSQSSSNTGNNTENGQTDGSAGGTDSGTDSGTDDGDSNSQDGTGNTTRDTTLDNEPLDITVTETVPIIEQAAGTDIAPLNTDATIGKDRQAELDAAIKKLEDKGYSVSFLLYDLKTNSGFTKNPDVSYYGAGTIVGPYVTALAERKVDKEEINMKTTKLNRDDLEEIGGGAGSIKNDPEGETYTLADVMERTVKEGDNNGYALLLQEYGQGFFDTWLKSGKVSGDYTQVKWPNYTVKALGEMWVSIAEYFTSDRGASQQVREMFTAADQSFIQNQLGGLYTVYSCPGYNSAENNVVWHDAALVMDDTYPYLLVIMTTASWSQDNTEDEESLRELTTALEGVHSDMVHPEKSIKPAVAASVTPTATATPTPEPESQKESKGGIPTAVWVVLAVIVVLARGLTARILYVKEMKRRRRLARMEARRRRQQALERGEELPRRRSSAQGARRSSGADSRRSSDGTGRRSSSSDGRRSSAQSARRSGSAGSQRRPGRRN